MIQERGASEEESEVSHGTPAILSINDDGRHDGWYWYYADTIINYNSLAERGGAIVGDEQATTVRVPCVVAAMLAGLHVCTPHPCIAPCTSAAPSYLLSHQLISSHTCIVHCSSYCSMGGINDDEWAERATIADSLVPPVSCLLLACLLTGRAVWWWLRVVVISHSRTKVLGEGSHVIH